MAKSSQQIEQEFISAIKTSTGKDLKDWMNIIEQKGLKKRNDVLNWLKKELDFGHMKASLLAGIYINGGKAVYADAGDLLREQFKKKEHLAPLYDGLVNAVQKAVKGTQLTAKKTYVSFHNPREFAALNIKSEELRLGLDLGDAAFTKTLEKSKLSGPMPRISHMVCIRSESDLNSKLTDLLKKANDRVNP